MTYQSQLFQNSFGLPGSKSEKKVCFATFSLDTTLLHSYLNFARSLGSPYVAASPPNETGVANTRLVSESPCMYSVSMLLHVY